MISSHIYCEQGTPKWWDLRSKNITASDFDKLMYGRPKTLQALADSIREGREFSELNYIKPLAHGKHFEKQARREYELITRRVITECGIFQHKDYRASASPDGIWRINLRHDGWNVVSGIEIKCPYDPSVHLGTLENGTPLKHKAQIQGNMWLTGAETWDFVSFDPRIDDPNMRIFIQTHERDESFISALEKRVAWFHEILESPLGLAYEPEREPDSMLLSDEKLL